MLRNLERMEEPSEELKYLLKAKIFEMLANEPNDFRISLAQVAVQSVCVWLIFNSIFGHFSPSFSFTRWFLLAISLRNNGQFDRNLFSFTSVGGGRPTPLQDLSRPPLLLFGTPEI